jgi:hypothetical protein
MKLKNKNKSGKFTISIVLYIAASVVALVGIASLVNNIFLFRNTVDQYVAQGYPTATVIKQLLPAQLLPGIFESIATYGGISFVLLGAGIINKKVSKCLTLLLKDNVCNDTIEESALKQNSVNVENSEIIEQAEIVEEIENV